MKKLKIAFLLFLQFNFFISTRAQINPLDSLTRALKNSKNDTTKLRLLIELSNACAEEDILKYAEPAAKLAQTLLSNSNKEIQKKAKKGLADADNNIGFASINKGESDKAIEFYKKSLLIRKEINDKKGIGECYVNIGYVLEQKGDISNALENYEKGLDFYEAGGDKRGMAYALNNMGYIYQKQDGLMKALEYYLKSMKIREDIDDKQGLSQSLTNIGAIYKNQKQYAKALETHLKSLSIQLELGDKMGASNSYNNIGYVYENQKNYIKALEYYQKSLAIREEIAEKRGIANTLNNIGRIYMINNDLPKAIESGKRSFQLSTELGFPEYLSNSSSLMAIIYKKQGNYKDALQMYELFLKMHDSINNENIRKTTAKQQIKYEYEKKASVDSIQNAESQKVKDAQIIAQDMQIKQEQTKRIALFIGLFLVIMFAGFMVNRFKISQRQKAIIEFQKRDVELQKDIVDEKQKEILDSINYAKRIQYTLLAHQEVLVSNIPDHFVLFQPKDIVSGDFYWATKKDNLFFLAVCDSTGHGVPGAFMSLLNISFMIEAINEKNILQPNEIFNYIRDRLISSISTDGAQDGMDGILLCIDNNTNSITYSAAYNEPIMIRDKQIIVLGADKMPIGKGEKTKPFSLFKIDQRANDMLYLFTDGYPDQFGGPKGKKFKFKQLNELLLANASSPSQTQQNILLDTFTDWKGDIEQVDDILLVGIRF